MYIPIYSRSYIFTKWSLRKLKSTTYTEVFGLHRDILPEMIQGCLFPGIHLFFETIVRGLTMQKSIIVPVILMIMMAFPAFGLPQGNSTDFNTIPVESYQTVVTNPESMQEPIQESMQDFTNDTGITAAGDAQQNSE